MYGTQAFSASFAYDVRGTLGVRSELVSLRYVISSHTVGNSVVRRGIT